MAGLFEGRCLCGAVRYRVAGPPRSPHWCHCEICRRATGAPAAAWANFPVASLQWLGAAPDWYESSPRVRRGFCGACGGSLCTLEDGDALISILIGSLDRAAEVAPDYHIWTRRQLPWLQIADGKPRHR